MITAESILKPRVTLAVLEQRAGRSLPATCRGTLAERICNVLQAANPEGHNQWTVERLAGGAMQSETFTKGERVSVFFHHGENGFKHGTVTGMSHANKTARVKMHGATGDYHAHHGFGSIYKYNGPADAPEVKRGKQESMAKVVDRVNKKKEPEGGWSDADAVPMAFQNYRSKATLATRISDLLQAAQPKPAKKEYGCLMAIAPESMRQKLVKWAEKNIPDADVDPKHGRETESHVTIYFGFNEGFNDFDKLAGLRLNGDPSIKLTLGKITRFECPEYDVLKVDIESPESERWNRRIGEEFADQVTPSEHDYHPHMTLCYLKKGTCKELDGSDVFEGETFSVKKLLYSECERKGRTTVHLSDKPSEPMKATDHSVDSNKMVMPPALAAARLRAQHIYEAAALAAIAAVEAKKKATKEQKRKDEAAILILLLLAGEDAYRETHTALGKAEPTATVPTPKELDGQAEEFAEQRQSVLKDFSGRLADTIRQTRDEAADAGKPPVEVVRELRRKVAKEAEVMADMEASCTVGSVQLDRLKRAGFYSAFWQTCEDEKVRPGHVLNGEAGAVELGKPFPDSCRFPGDPTAPIECTINCRCWLVGASREPIKKEAA